MLDDLRRDSGNEHFALHLSSRDIVFGADVSHAPPHRPTERIFQIAYTQELANTRAELLRKLGYPVISVIGNDAAKNLLTTLRRDNLGIVLFIVGHATTTQTRRKMIEWLKESFPKSKILSLNSANEVVSNADFNLEHDSHEVWLSFIATTMNSQPGT